MTCSLVCTVEKARLAACFAPEKIQENVTCLRGIHGRFGRDQARFKLLCYVHTVELKCMSHGPGVLPVVLS